jgi:putative addiction module killer protein
MRSSVTQTNESPEFPGRFISNIKWFSGLGEYKIDWGPGYRIYFLQDGNNLIVLLGGGTKARQQRDIEKAKALLKEYKSRK